MNNKRILLYLVIIIIFLVCLKNYLFKNHNIENFTNKRCISSYTPEEIQQSTLPVKSSTITEKVNSSVAILPRLTLDPDMKEYDPDMMKERPDQQWIEILNPKDESEVTTATTPAPTTITTSISIPTPTDDCSCGNLIITDSSPDSIGTCLAQHTNLCPDTEAKWKDDRICSNGETQEHSALSELSNCHNILSTYWNNIETLKQLGENIANMQCKYNFSDVEEANKKHNYFRQNIPCNQRPECKNNACIDIPGNTDPVNPVYRTCEPKATCSVTQYITNYGDTNTPFNCQNLTECKPGEKIAQTSELNSTNILDTKQYIENRTCNICHDGTFSSNVNSEECSVLTPVNYNQSIVSDAEYYIQKGNRYYTDDRILTNVFYKTDDQNPYNISLQLGLKDTIIFTKNTKQHYYEAIGPSLFLIHVTPNNKDTFSELCKNIYTFDETKLNTFFNTYLKGITHDPITNRKRDYYRWVIIKIEGDDKGLFIYEDNITEKFFDKYDSNSTLTKSEKKTYKINSSIIYYFNYNGINTGIITQQINPKLPYIFNLERLALQEI